MGTLCRAGGQCWNCPVLGSRCVHKLSRTAAADRAYACAKEEAWRERVKAEIAGTNKTGGCHDNIGNGW